MRNLSETNKQKVHKLDSVINASSEDVRRESFQPSSGSGFKFISQVSKLSGCFHTILPEARPTGTQVSS